MYQKENDHEKSEFVMELQLARTILEHLECSFACQEAKLDWLLEMKATLVKERTASRLSLQFTPCLPLHNQTKKFSILAPTSWPVDRSPKYPTKTRQMMPILDLERLPSDSNLTGEFFVLYLQQLSWLVAI